MHFPWTSGILQFRIVKIILLLQIKISYILMKSSNKWLLYKSWIIFYIIKSLIIYKKNINHFWEIFNNYLIFILLSMNNHLYFRFIIYLFIINSSKNMNCSSVHSVKCILHLFLRVSFCCKACRWSYNQ